MRILPGAQEKLWQRLHLVDAKDGWGLLALTLFAWVVTNWNHFAAWLVRPDGGYFLGHGFIFNNADFNSYVMKTLQGQLGYWRFDQWYTPEVQPLVWFNLVYLAWGNLTGWMNLAPLFALHLLRILLLPLLLYVLYRLCLRLGLGRGGTWVTLLLLVLPLQLNGLWSQQSRVLGGIFLPEASVFASLAYVPHFIVALLCFSALVWQAERIQAAPRLTLMHIAQTGCLILTLAAAYPFALALLLAWVGSRLVLTWLRGESGALGRMWRHTLVVLVISAIGMVYYVSQTRALEGYQGLWGEESYLQLPLPILVAELGVLGAPALGVWFWRLAQTRTRMTEFEISLGVWLLSGLMFFFLPLGFSPRLALGLQIPAVLLFAYYSRVIWPRFSSLLAAQLGISLLTLVLLIGLNRERVKAYNSYNISAAEQQVMDVLSAFTPGSLVVMSDFKLSNYLPVLARQRPVFGSQWETLHAKEKEAKVEAFYSSTVDTQQQEILRAYGVDYVIVSRAQRAAGFDVSKRTWLEPKWESEEVGLYRVNLPM